MRNDSLISVLMGTRASANQLDDMKRSIQSILNQRGVELELLICAAGADDAALDWLHQRSERDARIRLIERPELMLLGEKLNACLAVANGQWIARMDDDDYSYPERLNKQISFLKREARYAFAGSWVCEIGRDGRYVRKLPEYPTIEDFRITQPFVHPTLLFRRRALEAVGGYSESHWQDHCDDYDLLLRLYQKNMQGVNIQEVLLDYSIARSQEQCRPFKFYLNEAVTRAVRFSELGKVPAWGIYVVKPLVAGMIPQRTLRWLKKKIYNLKKTE